MQTIMKKKKKIMFGHLAVITYTILLKVRLFAFARALLTVVYIGHD